MQDHNQKQFHSLNLFTFMAGPAVVLIGVSILAGWAFDLSPIKNLPFSGKAMNPTTAFCFTLAGLALWLLRKKRSGGRTDLQTWLGTALAIAVTGIGFIRLSEYLWGWQIGSGIDAFLIQEKVLAENNRLAFNTSLGFIFLGLSLVSINWESRRGLKPAEVFAAMVTVVSFVALAGHIYDAVPLYEVASKLPMTLNTSICFILVGLGVLFARPERGIIGLVTTTASGGVLVRRLLPAIVLFQLLLGWLRIRGEVAGLYDTAMGVALNIVVGSLLLAVLVLLTSRSLNQSQAARLQAELKYREQNQILESIIQNVGIGLVVADNSGKFILFNSTAEKTLGIGATDATPDQWVDTYGVFHTDGKTPFPADQQPLVRALKGEAVDEQELFIRNPKVSQGVFISVTGRPVLDDNGKIQAGVVVFRDITERREQETRFQRLLESAPDALMLVDKNGQIKIVNSQTQKLFGYTSAELIGQQVETLMPESFRSRHAGHRQNFMSSPRTRQMGEGLELLGQRKDGSKFQVEISLSPIEMEGETHVIAAIRDVTEKKQRQRELLKLNQDLKSQTEQLVAVNKELEAFSYSVSHDLRAPLRGIDGFSLALMEDYDDKIDESGKDFLRRIRAATQRMGLLIDDLLKLSRFTRSEMQFQSLDLSAMVKKSVHELQKSDPRRIVNFEIEEGLTATGDPRLVQVVLDNLLQNAWKYTAKHPSAAIQFGRQSQPDGRAAFFIRDDGSGFDMAYSGKLFGIFQRLHTADEFEGTGVGLATVKRIINRHGGQVWAEGKIEKGATFYFTLQTEGGVYAQQSNPVSRG